MTPEELKRRTKDFALRIIHLIDTLPHTTTAREIGKQLLRSGTSVAANYRSACRARSKPEFIAKIGVVIEEADESAFWLEIIIEGKLLQHTEVESIRQEAEEITRIMSKSRATARKKD